MHVPPRVPMCEISSGRQPLGHALRSVREPRRAAEPPNLSGRLWRRGRVSTSRAPPLRDL
eukprot:1358677-Pyramimonas_sp.AAC.1